MESRKAQYLLHSAYCSRTLRSSLSAMPSVFCSLFSSFAYTAHDC